MKKGFKYSKKRRIIDLFLLLSVPLLFYSCVDEMIFQLPACSYRLSTHIIKIPTINGQQIAAFYLPPADDEYVVLFSHGNAEDIGQLKDFAQTYRLQGFGILAYDYRGYGLSEGKPSEENTYTDIEAAYQYLAMHEKIAPDRIIVHGRSVGSGPATWLAQQYPVAGLILESPFVSAYRVVMRWAIIPFDKFNNLARIGHIHCPVLVIHGRDDRIVPFWHGRTLYSTANEPKMHCWVEHAGHNDLVYQAGDEYWKTLSQFRNLIQTTQGKNDTANQ